MRTYVVQPGDSPAKIAARDDMAGCPKCASDLVAVNPHKPRVTLPNGFVTFRELRVGEVLNLPDKWFDGSLDRMPKSYFAALPSADGILGDGIYRGGRQVRGFALGLGPVTPQQVLAYRKTWEPYVSETIAALRACGDAWTAAASGATPAQRINTAQFAAPPDATTMKLWAQTQYGRADSLLTDWNAYAGLSDAQIVQLASDILQQEQSTVLAAGQFGPDLQNDCPQTTLPAPPTFDLQSQVIGQIEGAGILAHGVLQLIGIGAAGVLQTAGAVGSAAKQAVSVFASPAPWIAIAVVGGVYLVTQFLPRPQRAA